MLLIPRGIGYKQTQPEHQEDPSEDDGMMVVDGVAARTTTPLPWNLTCKDSFMI